jgi:hypothetical protein
VNESGMPALIKNSRKANELISGVEEIEPYIFEN